jgi:purine-binding chemotaxis protein CheW
MPDAGTASVGAEAARRFVAFRLASTLYALPTEYVSEVIQTPGAARVPHSPRALLGLANLRGTVLPLVGLRELLDLGDTPGGGAVSKAIVLDAGTPIALAVDTVDSLETIAEHRIEVREAELGARNGELLSGTFQARGAEVAKILDIERLLAAAFAQRARGASRGTKVSASAERTQPSATDAAPAAMLVTFDVGGQEFALDLEAVQEILSAPATLVAVPRAETLVLGVTSLRDRLLPLLSLRGLLGLPPKSGSDGREKVVVMTVGGAQVGLVVDRARAILAARPSAVDPIPMVLAARTGGEARIKAIYRGEEGRRLVSILSPEQLFREDVMRRLDQGGQKESRESARGASAQQSELQFLVFRLGNDEFGLPIDCVDEVGEVPPKITRLPKTPKFLEGVVNLRGNVLPVVDQRRRFDMPAQGGDARRRLVVVRTERHRAGLIVDGVSDVLRVATSALEPAPALTEQIARLVRGVINLEKSQRIVLVLDPAELLTPAERGRLDAFQEARRANA